MTLPFLGLIMSIMRHERVWIPFGLLVMKTEDQIFAQTMTRSKAHLCGLDEGEEKAKGEDTAHKGGNTDEDIDNFTLELEDMEASPSKRQEQHGLSLRDNHMHHLMLLITSIYFF